MSITRDAIWASSPSTDIFHPTSLSADSKGERIVYASNKSIFVRSIDHPEDSKEYTGHTKQTSVAKFSPSGFYVASGDVSGMVRVWDAVGEGATKGEYPIISGRINDIAWDGDSQRIIAVGDGKERFGHCITYDSGNSVGEISGHNKEINAVSIRQQRPLRAATAGADKVVGFFHGAPFKYNTSMRAQHTGGEVSAVAFSPDGSFLVSVGRDKMIWLYDGKTGEPQRQIGKGDHAGSILGVSWAQDSQKFVTSSADKTVKLWDATSGEVTHTWTMSGDGPGGQQCGVVWPHRRTDGLVISLDVAGNLNYLYPDSEEPRKIIQGHQKSIISCLLTQDSSKPTLITGSSDGKALAWDVSTGRASDIEGLAHSASPIRAFAAAQNSPTIWSLGLDDNLRPIDVNAKTFIETALRTDGSAKGIATTGDSSTVLVATASNLSVYDTSSGSRINVEALSDGVAATCLASNNKDLAVVGGSDKSLHVYTLSSQRKLSHQRTVNEALKSEPSTLCFSPDGAYLAVGTALGGINVYKTADWSLLTSRWSAHTARVTSVCWSPDSLHAVSGALDTHVFVWSVDAPGRRVKATNAHKDGVNGVVWLALGGKHRALSVGSDGCVKVWNISTA